MGMFANLGPALSLLRELRAKSLTRVAREAGIGKSQLSKYENGKELPKLDSLEKVLGALEVGHFDFFYTLHLVDRRAAELAGGGGEAGSGLLGMDRPGPLLDKDLDRAFSQIVSDLLVLYRRSFERALAAAFDSQKPKSAN
jgi:transcriptional regulator with XRE-family HTH domain